MTLLCHFNWGIALENGLKKKKSWFLLLAWQCTFFIGLFMWEPSWALNQAVCLSVNPSTQDSGALWCQCQKNNCHIVDRKSTQNIDLWRFPLMLQECCWPLCSPYPCVMLAESSLNQRKWLSEERQSLFLNISHKIYSELKKNISPWLFPYPWHTSLYIYFLKVNSHKPTINKVVTTTVPQRGIGTLGQWQPSRLQSMEFLIKS